MCVHYDQDLYDQYLYDLLISTPHSRKLSSIFHLEEITLNCISSIPSLRTRQVEKSHYRRITQEEKRDMTAKDEKKPNIVEIEKSLIDDDKGVYLLTDTINGPVVRGVFTSYKGIKTYMYRQAINWTINAWNSSDHESYIKERKDPIKSFREAAEDLFHIIPLTHVNPCNGSIYVIQTDNYRVYGKPIDYLTHSADKWKVKMKGRHITIENCTMKIDPPLEKLEELVVF